MLSGAGSFPDRYLNMASGMRQDIAFHPLANIFPLMQVKVFADFKANIKAEGLREPVVIFEGMILDGRNRFRACQEVGITPEFIEYRGGDPLAYVISLNLHRRHLSESQRAMVADKIAALPGGSNQHAQICAPSQSEAAGLLNVSRRTVQTAHTVSEHGAPELVDAVEQGRVSVSAAADVATLPQEEQVEVVAGGGKEIRARVREVREKKKAPKRNRSSAGSTVSAVNELALCATATTPQLVLRKATDNQRAQLKESIRRAYVFISQLYEELENVSD